MPDIIDKQRRPDITFRRDGRIDITALLARYLHLNDGDVIGIVTEGNEHLLYVRLMNTNRVGRHIGQVRRSNKSGNNFRTYAKEFTDAIFRIIGAGRDTDIIRLAAGDPVVYGPNGTAIPLITKNPL